MPPCFVVVLGVGGRVACGELYGLFIPLLLRIWYTFFFARYNREVSPNPLMRFLFPFLMRSYNVHCSFFCSCATFKRSVLKDIISNHYLLLSIFPRLAGGFLVLIPYYHNSVYLSSVFVKAIQDYLYLFIFAVVLGAGSVGIQASVNLPTGGGYR